MIKIICQEDGLVLRIAQVKKRYLVATATDHRGDDQKPAVLADIGQE